MAIFKKSTPEEEAERKLVRKNVRTKTFVIACKLAFLSWSFVFFIGIVFSIFKSSYVPAVVAPFVGAALAGVAFEFTLFIGWFMFSREENDKSKKRLAQLAEDKRLAQEQADQAAQQRRSEQEQARQEAMRAATQEQEAALREQKRRDSREYILRKLSNANTYIDLYDPDHSDSARVRQGISRELSDIMVNHSSHAELAAMIAQEPDVRGMVVFLRDRLRAKGIDSAEASQILAALP